MGEREKVCDLTHIKHFLFTVYTFMVLPEIREPKYFRMRFQLNSPFSWGLSRQTEKNKLKI